MALPVKTDHHRIRSDAHNIYIAAVRKIDGARLACQIDRAVLVLVGYQGKRRGTRYLDPRHIRAGGRSSPDRIEPCALEAHLELASHSLSAQVIRRLAERNHGKSHQYSDHDQNDQRFDQRDTSLIVGLLHLLTPKKAETKGEILVKKPINFVSHGF